MIEEVRPLVEPKGSVLADVRAWLLQQPEFLQEAAERFIKKGRLNSEDIQDVCDLLKTQEGQVVSKTRNFDSLLEPLNAEGELYLISIGEVKGIERLATDGPLVFGKKKLTVIYGHNGSGKSSYTRILKKVTGKPRALELNPNVYAPAPLEQRCKITYDMQGQSVMMDWKPSDTCIDELCSIDIFDADEANHYLRNESAVTYTPPLVSMFESLAGACDQVKALLQKDQEQLLKILPNMPDSYVQTEVGKKYRGLTAGVSELEISELLTWTDAQAQELTSVTALLNVEDSDDLAKKKRASKLKVLKIATSLQAACVAFGDENLQAIRNLREEAKEKRRVVADAGQLDSALIAKVGSATWRALWDAAKAYSQIAYPNKEFPVTTDAHCVLCHQELATEAQQRLRSFEGFVQGQLEKEANEAETAYENALRAFPSISDSEEIINQCMAAGFEVEKCIAGLIDFWELARIVRDGMLAGELHGQVQPLTDHANIKSALIAHAEDLERYAIDYDSHTKRFDRAQISQNKTELEAKQWIQQQADAVRKEISRLKQLKIIDDWKVLAGSRAISTEASVISQKVITDAYVDRFNQELKELGVSGRIQVQLVKTKVEKGRALHKLELKGANGKHRIELVLSEGERRIIALAAFLADVTNKPGNGPFVFDDPISSLDHDFEWMVAKRLAKLATTRQVLVFTHRLSLYGAMDDVAKKHGETWKTAHFQKLCIESYGGCAGRPTDERIWNSNTKNANNILLGRLDVAKKAGDNGGSTAYLSLAQGICSDFRKLLERTVEDDLLNEVVRRHRRSVTTENRLGALASIEASDCHFIDSMMTKYSFHEHSQSQEVPSFTPEEPELRRDIMELADWRKSFKNRIKDAS